MSKLVTQPSFRAVGETQASGRHNRDIICDLVWKGRGGHESGDEISLFVPGIK